MSFPQDIRAFLAHYHGQEDDPGASDNLLFYRNQLRCKPDHLLISEILQRYEPTILSAQHGIDVAANSTAGGKIIGC
jgi:hypothetical protein